VRGSLMSVEYDPATGQMIVTCLEGRCRLTGSSGTFIDLSAGEQSEIGGAGQSPTPAHLLDEAQLADWTREVPEAQAAILAVAALPRPAVPGITQAAAGVAAPGGASTSVPRTRAPATSTPPFGGQGPADIPGFGPDDELVSADQDSLVYLIGEGFFEKVPLVYEEIMPQSGWELKPGSVVSEGQTVTMQFTKGGRTATLVISLEPDGRTRVEIEVTGQ
jgi:hypothetical protein